MSQVVSHQCPECGGSMYENIINYEERDKAGRLYVFENVPAWICSQCSFIYLEASVDKRLDEIIAQDAPIKKIETAVFDYSKS